MMLIKFPTIVKNSDPWAVGPEMWINVESIDAIVPKVQRCSEGTKEGATIILRGQSLDVFATVAAIVKVIEKANALAQDNITADQFFASLNELIHYAES
jgi:hypothetical protein